MKSFIFLNCILSVNFVVYFNNLLQHLSTLTCTLWILLLCTFTSMMCFLSTTSKNPTNFFPQIKKYSFLVSTFPFFTIPGPQPYSPEALRLMRKAYEENEEGKKILRHFDDVIASLPSQNSPY